MKLLPVLRIVVLVCAGLAWSKPSDAATTGVTTFNLTFVPPDVTIEVGDSVHWTGLLAGIHTVAEVDDAAALTWNGGFQSPSSANEFTHTFNSPGVFYYICVPHRFSDMRGTVTVTVPVQIPTVSEWGLIVLILFMLATGIAMIQRRPKTPARE